MTSAPVDGPAQAHDGIVVNAVDYQHSANLAGVLDQLGVSILVSTYQAGKVFTIGVNANALQIRFYHFDQPMGLARTPTGLAICTRRQVWSLPGAPDLAALLQPPGLYDSCFLTMYGYFTGPIQGHELAWCKGELWVVNTLFSCLCVLQPTFSFVPRWQPPFISTLAAEDRCHLNGMAADDERPRYVTALGECDTAAGWRANKVSGGCLIDVTTGEVVLRGLCMPHSPRIHQGQLWVLNSGRGQLSLCDPAAGSLDTVAQLPGYARGLDCVGRYAFVGLSRIRETAVFGGLPIGAPGAELRCGVAVVDMTSGQILATMFFTSRVEEIFDVKVLPGCRSPMLSGPFPDVDKTETLWLVPPSGTVSSVKIS